MVWNRGSISRTSHKYIEEKATCGCIVVVKVYVGMVAPEKSHTKKSESHE